MKVSESTVKLWSAASSPSDSIENVYAATQQHSLAPSVGLVTTTTESLRLHEHQQQQHQHSQHSQRRAGGGAGEAGGPVSQQRPATTSRTIAFNGAQIDQNRQTSSATLAKPASGQADQQLSNHQPAPAGSADGTMGRGQPDSDVRGGSRGISKAASSGGVCSVYGLASVNSAHVEGSISSKVISGNSSSSNGSHHSRHSGNGSSSYSNGGAHLIGGFSGSGGSNGSSSWSQSVFSRCYLGKIRTILIALVVFSVATVGFSQYFMDSSTFTSRLHIFN
uniref:Uncharacterized protein n=1 Tax=Anopheles albimanus TaxID=7167 RepID=A0A182FC53_ANOAL